MSATHALRAVLYARIQLSALSAKSSITSQHLTHVQHALEIAKLVLQVASAYHAGMSTIYQAHLAYYAPARSQTAIAVLTQHIVWTVVSATS